MKAWTCLPGSMSQGSSPMEATSSSVEAKTPERSGQSVGLAEGRKGAQNSRAAQKASSRPSGIHCRAYRRLLAKRITTSALAMMRLRVLPQMGPQTHVSFHSPRTPRRSGDNSPHARAWFEPGTGLLVLPFPLHSVRNACMGSIRAALQAGTRQASAATASSVAVTAAKIAGSSARVP